MGRGERGEGSSLPTRASSTCSSCLQIASPSARSSSRVPIRAIKLAAQRMAAMRFRTAVAFASLTASRPIGIRYHM